MELKRHKHHHIFTQLFDVSETNIRWLTGPNSQGELMGSPWFSRVTRFLRLSVTGLFFLEASNPGGTLLRRHRGRPPAPLHVCSVCRTHTLSFPPGPTNANHCAGPLGFWRPSARLEQTCLIWPAEGKRGGGVGGRASQERRRLVNTRPGEGTRRPTKLPKTLPRSLLPASPLSLGAAPQDQEAWLPSNTPPFPLPPFSPLLTERKYCNRGGRRSSLLRRRLKITGIFKAAVESRGRHRLDSLPAGRSSRFPLCASSP